VLKSWRLQGSGLALLDTYAAGSDQFTEVAISGTRPGDVPNGRAVTATVRNYFGLTELYDDVWAVDHATGMISKLGELKEPFTHANVAITPFSVTTADGERQAPEYFAVGFRNTIGAPGDLELSVNRIDASGKPVHEGARYNSGIPAEQVRLAPLATSGLMAATRDVQGHVQLMAWEVARESDDTIDPKLVSQHRGSDAISLDMCRVPSLHAEGRLRDVDEGPRRAAAPPRLSLRRPPVLISGTRAPATAGASARPQAQQTSGGRSKAKRSAVAALGVRR
jgi:hypothetical protein